MTPGLCVRRGLGTAVVFALLTGTASAQLLSNLLQPVVTTTTSALCSVTALAASPKVDAEVRRLVNRGTTSPVRVIVTSQPGLLGTVRSLVTLLGGTLLGDLPGIGAVVTELKVAQLALLSCDLSVSSISIDAKVAVTSALPTDAEAYSLRATLGLTPSSPTGAGIGVAVIDSGIASSPDFGNRITAFYDFTRGGVAAVPTDAFGHGTHVAGLIAGAGSQYGNGLYRGAAPGARLIGLRVLDGTGAGRTSDVIKAIEYATSRRNTLGIDVINLSLGHPIYEPAKRDPLVRAVDAASRAGIIVVVAAGNYGSNRQTGEVGYGGITSPGNAPSAITVGAESTNETVTRADDGVTNYSSRGPTWYDAIAKPDLVAPGHQLVSNVSSSSALYAQYPNSRVSSQYIRLSGTSMATAVVSGSVALMLEAQRALLPGTPRLTSNTVKAILQYTSLRLSDASGAPYDALTQGAGALNTAAAVELAASTDTSRQRGAYWWTRVLTPSTTIGGYTATWGQGIVWGGAIVWGSTVDVNRTAWSSGIVWGSTVADWNNAVSWGENVVWDNGQSWGSAIVWGSQFVGAMRSEQIVWGSADQPGTTVWRDVNDSGQGQGTATPTSTAP